MRKPLQAAMVQNMLLGRLVESWACTLMWQLALAACAPREIYRLVWSRCIWPQESYVYIYTRICVWWCLRIGMPQTSMFWNSTAFGALHMGIPILRHTHISDISKHHIMLKSIDMLWRPSSLKLTQRTKPHPSWRVYMYMCGLEPSAAPSFRCVLQVVAIDLPEPCQEEAGMI